MLLMKRAGAAAPSANRITLLRDANGDGIAVTRTVFLQGLNSPFGMTLVGNDLYVATTNGLGVATSPIFTANGTLGSYTVTASIPGLAAPVSFNLSNVAPLIVTKSSG